MWTKNGLPPGNIMNGLKIAPHGRPSRRTARDNTDRPTLCDGVASVEADAGCDFLRL